MCDTELRGYCYHCFLNLQLPFKKSIVFDHLSIPILRLYDNSDQGQIRTENQLRTTGKFGRNFEIRPKLIRILA